MFASFPGCLVLVFPVSRFPFPFPVDCIGMERGRLTSVLVAGGGLRMGQVIGESNSKGEEPTDAPYRPENVLAMVYRHLGIDPAGTIKDLTGRPRFLLEERRLIGKLV